MKYAIVRLGGKQLKISEGDTFEIEHQNALNFDVLALSEDGDIMIGEPILKDVKIKASIIGEKKSDKVVVARFKAKSRYRKVRGHRQMMSTVKIEEISTGKPSPKPLGEKTEKKPVKMAVEKKVIKRGRPKKVASVKRSVRK